MKVCFRDGTVKELNCLRAANLSGADLSQADLRRADLSDADLRRADLRGANLRAANLSGANLSQADLKWADLRGANLKGANLSQADLKWADLRVANLKGANLSGASLENFSIVPENGNFTGFKKLAENKIATLRIIGKRVSSLVGRKCRTDAAEVINIIDTVTGDTVNEGQSNYDDTFIYKVGQTVIESNYDDDIRIECAQGIHFFITFKEAKEY